MGGTEEAGGRSDIERGGGSISVCCGGGGGGGGEGSGGDGSSSVAKWPCKYDSSACKFTTCPSKSCHPSI